MISKKFLLVLLLVILAIALLYKPLKLAKKYYLTQCAGQGPEKLTDLKGYFERIELNDYNNALLSFSDQFEVAVVETVHYEGKEYFIYKVHKQETEASKKLFIIAATHGYEFASALVIPQLLRDMVDNPDLYASWDIQILTPANPVGLEHESRYNGDGCDINRDFGEFRTVEARLQRDLIEEYKPDIVVSLHEAPEDGFFIYGEGIVSRDLEHSILNALEENNVKLSSTNTFKFPLKTPGLNHKGPFIYKVQDVLNIKTFGKYYNDRGIPVITAESSWMGIDIQERIKPHLITIKEVIENFVK